MDQKNNLQPGLIIESRFKLLKKIGSGSFGIVYLTYDLEEKEYCATKFESRNLQLRMMNREILILKQLKGINGKQLQIQYIQFQVFQNQFIMAKIANINIIQVHCWVRIQKSYYKNAVVNLHYKLYFNYLYN
ncbi:unnamed protein product [Paramecium primaurelia]|uniref:Protein kinase domain-containing protein n=1 Tax=Paramecium primaurelia TaxID=5886 RepID=A0A8S1M7R9_PARPR|nr:unnamed protein product [Paramecium primaurelia]